MKTGFIYLGRIWETEYQWHGDQKVHKKCMATDIKLPEWMEEIEGLVQYGILAKGPLASGNMKLSIFIDPPKFERIK